MPVVFRQKKSLGVRHRFFFVAFLLLGYSFCFFLISHFFFTRKLAMHWDEITRFAWPGITPVPMTLAGISRNFFHLNDNLKDLVFVENIFRFFGVPVEATFLIVKYLVGGVTVLAMVSFAENWFGPKKSKLVLFSSVLTLCCPMMWLQFNELMSEPLFAPISIFWWILFKRALEGYQKKWLVWVLVSVLAVVTNFQQTLAIFGCGGVVLLMNILFFEQASALEGRLSRLYKMGLFIGTAIAAAFLFWWVSDGLPDTAEVWRFLSSQFHEAGNNHSAIAQEMLPSDRFLFGWRNLWWIYLPGWGLCSFLALTTLFRRPESFRKNRTWFLIGLFELAVFSVGYMGNMQDRYRYAPNLLLSVAICCFLIEQISLLCSSRQMPSIGNKNRMAVIIMASTFFMVISGDDYFRIWKEYSCFGNLQDFGVYDFDSGACDKSRTFFGLMPRKDWITFYKIERSAQFPNSGSADLRGALDKIKENLNEKAAPEVSPNNPNFVNSATVSLWYFEKFGKMPVDDNPIRQRISLAYEDSSPLMNTSYRELEGKSLLSAQKEMNILLVTHSVLAQQKMNFIGGVDYWAITYQSGPTATTR